MAQWRDEWELRILVLASLSAQFTLVLFVAVRKFRISPWLSFSFRLAHIGSDALAIFALATLFSRQKSGPLCRYERGSRDLELLWAPILLMHLGGQIIITTYKIEDNEHSTQYLLTSLSKVTVALYVFYKTWSSNDKRLLAATILLFILVIIRCFQKFLDLKETSLNALRKASEVSVTEIGGDEQLDQFILKAMSVYRNMQPPTLQTVSIPILPFQLFLDVPCSCSDRLEMLIHFCSLERESVLKAIEEPLFRMTKFLYTKGNERYPSLPFISGFIVRFITLPLVATALCTAFILVASHTPLILLSPTTKKTAIHYVPSHLATDRWITLGLLGGTLVVELIYSLVEQYFPGKFSGRILQHSLIGLFAHNRRHSTLRSIAGWLQCKDLLDRLWRVEPGDSCEDITELVRCHVQTGWTEYIRDPYSYRMFNDTRGEWTLARNRCLRQLGWSTRRAFDESVVLWHLATDICFHHTDHTSPDDYVRARQCKVMSNYMVHLLSDNPEMLMPGSRKRLISIAYKELEVLLVGKVTPRDEKELTRRVFEECERLSQDTAAASLIGDAWKLAHSLLSVDETKIWELIQGVWVEMLCFSASRCRGYLHAEALGTGGEFLSYVLVLLARTGMETFPEKLQRRDCNSFVSDESSGFGLAREGGGDVTPLAPTEVEMSSEELQRSEGHSFDSDESLDLGSAPESGDVVTPLDAQSEGTVDIVLEP